MAIDRPLHFQIKTIIGSQKPGRNQQQNNFRRFQVGFNFLIPLGSRLDIPILPGFDFALPFQRR